MSGQRTTDSHPLPGIPAAVRIHCGKDTRLRELDKAGNTFIDNILKFAHKEDAPQFHQLRSDDGGTVTGGSLKQPQFQQIPARDPEIKAMIRGLFIPDDDCKWKALTTKPRAKLLVHYYAAWAPSTRVR